METRNALIAGATGLVGNELLQLLLSDPSYSKVLILVRKKIPVDHPKLIQLQVDFNRIESLSIPVQVQDAFCTLGTTIRTAGSQEAFRKVDYDYVVGLGKLCEKNKISKFLVVSAMGADVSSRVFYNRVKGEMENTVGQLAIPSIIICRPSLLMGKRRESRPGERLAQAVMGGLGFLFVGGLKKYKAIQARTVAAAMIAAAAANTGKFRMLNSGEMQDAGTGS